MTQDEDRDVELERMAARLGARAAERLDVERTAAAVVARLRAERAAQRRWWVRPTWLSLAAVLVLAIGAVFVVRWRTGGGPSTSGPDAPLVSADLQGLSTEQLQEVLGGLEQTLATPATEPADEDLNDLTTEQLRALLRSLEG